MLALCSIIDMHLELEVRDLYPQAFFGGTVSESSQARVRKKLAKNILAFTKLAKFSSYVAADAFALVDCAAWASGLLCKK